MSYQSLDALMNPEYEHSNSLVSLSAEIVSAYVSKNPVPVSALPALIGSVHRSLAALGSEQAAAPVEPQKPAVPIKSKRLADRLRIWA